MSQNIFISKKPGDGTVFNLRESLSKHEGELIVLEVETPGFNGNFNDQIEQHLKANPEVPINLVIDLFQASSLQRWAGPVGEILVDRKIGGVSLPENAAIILIVRDDPVFDANLRSALSSRCHFSIKGNEVARLNPGRLLADTRAGVEPGKRHIDLDPEHGFSR